MYKDLHGLVSPSLNDFIKLRALAPVPLEGKVRCPAGKHSIWTDCVVSEGKYKLECS